jgi:hypothetical protein
MIYRLLPFVLGIAVLAMVFLYKFSTKYFDEDMDEQRDLIVENCMNIVNVAFLNCVTIERNFNNILSNFKAVMPNNRRNYYSNAIQHLLSVSPNVRAMWVDFEPNVFDGLDAQFANTPYYSELGAFDMLWEKPAYGPMQRIAMDTAMINSAASKDFIKLAREYRSTIITSPYRYAYTTMDGEEKVFVIATISSPVFDADSNIIAIAGIDIDMNDISNTLLERLPVYVHSVGLLDKKGDYYLSTRQPELSLKNMRDNRMWYGVNTDSLVKSSLTNGLAGITKDKGGNKQYIYTMRTLDIENIANGTIIVSTGLLQDIVDVNSGSLNSILGVLLIAMLFLLGGGFVMIGIWLDNYYENEIIFYVQTQIDNSDGTNTSLFNFASNQNLDG